MFENLVKTARKNTEAMVNQDGTTTGRIGVTQENIAAEPQTVINGVVANPASFIASWTRQVHPSSQEVESKPAEEVVAKVKEVVEETQNFVSELVNQYEPKVLVVEDTIELNVKTEPAYKYSLGEPVKEGSKVVGYSLTDLGSNKTEVYPIDMVKQAIKSGAVENASVASNGRVVRGKEEETN